MRRFQTHGDGRFDRSDLKAIGEHVVLEAGVRMWHPEQISIGENVYVGHDTMLKGYHKNSLTIGSNTWIGQGVFIHGAGGVFIGDEVGIGPGVKMLTSSHDIDDRSIAILNSPLTFAPIVVESQSDIGVGAIIMPGVTIGQGAQVGAGSVVTRDVAPYAVVVGNPATVLRHRAP